MQRLQTYAVGAAAVVNSSDLGTAENVARLRTCNVPDNGQRYTNVLPPRRRTTCAYDIIYTAFNICFPSSSNFKFFYLLFCFIFHHFFLSATLLLVELVA